MKATILVDSTRAGNLKAEWGLSILVEYNRKKILIDTGASSNFFKNAEMCGISIKDVDAGILSHAHYDHANGLETFFRENSTAKFYLLKTCRENCYSSRRFHNRYIGIKKGILEKYKDRLKHQLGDGFDDFMKEIGGRTHLSADESDLFEKLSLKAYKSTQDYLDKKEREKADAVNKGDRIIFEQEKMLEDQKNTITESEKSTIEGYVSQMKDAVKAKDVSKINELEKSLNDAWQTVSQRVYGQQQAQAQTEQPQQEAAQAQPNVEDAEFTEVN